jgi:hypothetical protein
MKHVLLITTCTVQTAHDATRPLDHPANEYPTCATIPGPLYQVSYSCHDPHHCMPHCTCHLHTTRQANTILHTNKDKGKTNEIVLDSNSNLAKSMTHHNQIKERTTWFLKSFGTQALLGPSWLVNKCFGTQMARGLL